MKNLSDKKIMFFTILICFLYAVCDEIHQYFVPGRACRVFDVLVDTAGSAFFLIISFLYSKFKRV